ncbi:hypothetical protein CDD83_5669 [Cordyceps sp. RAO-2017]|nr:hypothetical protein CDD83_5669 [Cordyceps sp. RAO-2017]
MRSAISSLAVLPLASLAQAAPRGSAGSQGEGFVHMPLTYRAEDKFSTVDIGLGTPQQSVRVLVNTGSYTLWVNPSCSARGTCPERTFVKQDSTTFKDLGRVKTEPYRERVTYRFATDKLSLGSVNLDNHLFGVGESFKIEQSSRRTELSEADDLHKLIPYGLMGISRVNASDPDGERASVLKSLLSGGHIRTEAFSLDVQGPEDDGSLIFGGVDVKKFSGPLQKIPMLDDGKPSYNVKLDGVAVTKGGNTKVVSEGKISISLMTGTPVSILPDTIMNQVYDMYQEVNRQQPPHSLVCDFVKDAEGTLDFRFGSVTIKVPIKELITPQNESFRGYCDFNIIPIVPQDGAYTLGNDILKHAYIVYDSAHSNVHIGNSKNCGKKVVPLDADTNIDTLNGEC